MTNDIIRILKSNPDSFLSIKEISELMGVSVQSVTRQMKSMNKGNNLDTKEILGKNNTKTSLYKLKCTDDSFEEAVHQYNILRNEPRFQYMSADGLRQLMIISELKKLNEAKKNGS